MFTYEIVHRTVVSLGDGATNQESTKEQIFENIRLHKEVLQSVKMQPWSMRRKLRLVRQVSLSLQKLYSLQTMFNHQYKIKEPFTHTHPIPCQWNIYIAFMNRFCPTY